MALVSMTGFADAQGGRDGARWRWEAKSVNGKGLDLRLRTPPGFDAIEPPARMLANERFRRGSIQATLTIEVPESARGLRIDAVALASAVRIAQEIAAETGLPPARIDGLLALKGVIVQDDVVPADAAARGERDAGILETLAAAFDALARARRTEGAKLSAVLTAQIGEIERLTGEAGRLAAAQPAALRDKLAAQLKDLLDAGTVAETGWRRRWRCWRCAATCARNSNRLQSHVQEARALLASGEAVGRKLDFLAQEFNREANTLCSKSADIQLTRTGLALKAAIDQFREQAQNVE